MGRDRGKGRGGGRGGGRRMEVANEEEMALRERQIVEDRERRKARRGEDEEEEGKLGAVDEDDEDEESDEEDEAPKKPKPIKPHNPNYVKKPEVSDDPNAGLTRKQRDELEAQRAKEEYMKRHLAGQTEEARRDLERLAIIRQRREEQAKKREAEGRAPGMSKTGLPSDSDGDDDDDSDDSDSDDEKQPITKPAAVPVLSEAQAKKKAAALDTATPSGEIPKLKAMDIKKMNGDALKDALRERNLDVQGQKKDLMKRLLDYEAARG